MCNISSSYDWYRTISDTPLRTLPCPLADDMSRVEHQQD